jgi:two-component system nitrate/nitrite response regulator NarL
MRVLVVDDHPILCTALAKYLEELGNASFGSPITTTTVHTIDEAIAAVQSEPHPDLVFLDLNIDQQYHGSATLKRLQMCNSARVPVVVFTGLSLDDRGTAGILRECYNELTAHSILLKSAKLETMLRGLTQIMAGERWLSDEIISALLRTPSSNSALDLSPRQWDVAHGIACGLRNKEIARKLGLSDGNVRQMVSAIYKRLGVHSRIAVGNVVRKVESNDYTDCLLPGQEAAMSVFSRTDASSSRLIGLVKS